jgi:rSAM/selenodomain-associated transferase 2
MISIIIPTYNEERIITKNLSHFEGLRDKAELIIVDGESSDGTKDIARKVGTVISSAKGRAIQMNKGVLSSTGEVLLFLHADTYITPEILQSIENVMKDNEILGGCLTQRIDKEGVSLRLFEGFGNMRARLTRVFYGDQGIFVRKNVFNQIGAFPEVPVMEDVMFTKKLRKQGKTAVLPDKIMVSPRRIEEKGLIRTFLLYSLINMIKEK